jgi:aspartate racemase
LSGDRTKKINAKKVKIGVLGGIGPEATAVFYKKLIEQIQNNFDIKSNKEFPQIFINSIPAPELIRNTISKEELKPYIIGLKELDEQNPDFIIMVCNTIHLYYNRLQKTVRTKILDVRKEVANELKSQKIRSALIIGTPCTTKRL